MSTVTVMSKNYVIDKNDNQRTKKVQNKENALSYLKDMEQFSTQDLALCLKENGTYGTERELYRLLKLWQDKGIVTRVSRNRYVTELNKMKYSYRSTDALMEVTGHIQGQFPLISFQTWELFQ